MVEGPEISVGGR